jgi:hypothetical protein
MLPGHRRRLLTPGKNESRFVAGALDAATGKLTWAQSASKASSGSRPVLPDRLRAGEEGPHIRR